jgi:hypothetical protein
MSLTEFLKWYFRSALGIGTLFAGVLCAGVLFAMGISVAVAIPAGFTFIGVSGGAALALGAGSKAIVAERDSAVSRENREKVEIARGTRDKLSRLRIPDSAVSDTVSAVTLAASEYLDACAKASVYDPIANSALSECMEIVGIYLKELDDTSTEKRYALKDADPFVDARSRTIDALKERAMILRERRIQIDGGLSGEDQLSVREELR